MTNWDRYDRNTERIWRVSLGLLAFGLIGGTVSGCGDHPIPAHGTVIDRDFTPAWVQIIPGTPPVCSGNPPVCTGGMPMQIISHPDQWSMTIRDLDNADWEGTVTDYHSHTYDQCEVGELWPECFGGEIEQR